MFAQVQYRSMAGRLVLVVDKNHAQRNAAVRERNSTVVLLEEQAGLAQATPGLDDVGKDPP